MLTFGRSGGDWLLAKRTLDHELWDSHTIIRRFSCGSINKNFIELLRITTIGDIAYYSKLNVSNSAKIIKATLGNIAFGFFR